MVEKAHQSPKDKAVVCKTKSWDSWSSSGRGQLWLLFCEKLGEKGLMGTSTQRYEVTEGRYAIDLELDKFHRIDAHYISYDKKVK